MSVGRVFLSAFGPAASRLSMAWLRGRIHRCTDIYIPYVCYTYTWQTGTPIGPHGVTTRCVCVYVCACALLQKNLSASPGALTHVNHFIRAPHFPYVFLPFLLLSLSLSLLNFLYFALFFSFVSKKKLDVHNSYSSYLRRVVSQLSHRRHNKHEISTRRNPTLRKAKKKADRKKKYNVIFMYIYIGWIVTLYIYI